MTNAHACTYCGHRVDIANDELIVMPDAQYMHVSWEGCAATLARVDRAVGQVWRSRSSFMTTAPIEPDGDFGWPPAV